MRSLGVFEHMCVRVLVGEGAVCINFIYTCGVCSRLQWDYVCLFWLLRLIKQY